MGSQEFFEETGYNQEEVIRHFVLDFAQKYPHVNTQSLDLETVREFLHRPYVVMAGAEQKMNLLYDYVLSQGLCEISL